MTYCGFRLGAAYKPSAPRSSGCEVRVALDDARPARFQRLEEHEARPRYILSLGAIAVVAIPGFIRGDVEQAWYTSTLHKHLAAFDDSAPGVL